MADAEQIYRKASTLDDGRLQTLAEFLDFLLTREFASPDGKPCSPTAVASPEVSGVVVARARPLAPINDAREGNGRTAQAVPWTELGRTLRAIRQRAINQGMPLQTVDDILAEVREDRAEVGDDQDLH